MDYLKVNNELLQKKDELMERYFRYLDVSDLTQKEYNIGLKSFFSYCYENNITDIQRETIINFREYLKNKNREATTINLYLVGIKSFFKWLEYEGVYKDISRNIKSLPVETSHKREAFTIEQVQHLLNHCKNDKEKLIISIAVTTGIRCNELCNIRLQDFKDKNGTICLYVLGKARQGMRTDFVVIPNGLYNQIQKYVEENNITEYLFTSESNNNKGAILSTRAVRNMINKVFDLAGFSQEQYVFHSLRHSHATISIQNGVDIKEISQSLRHKNISTTMTYIHDLEMKDNKCSNTIENLLLTK